MSLQQTTNGTNTGGGDNEIRKMLIDINKVVKDMAADKDLKKLKFSESINTTDIRKALSDYTPQSSTKSSTRDKVEGFLNRTLQFVQTIGGVVAESASFGVGPPATACYNALNFVIKAYQNYKRSFEILGQLLETCLDSLENFDGYFKTYVGPSLKRVACKQLQLFVKTCEYALRLRHSRRSKIIAFLKITFFNDDYVQTLLAKQKELNQKELSAAMSNLTTMVDTVGKDVKIVVKSVDNLLYKQEEDRREQKTEKAKGEQRASLLKVLKWRDTLDGKAQDGSETLLSQHVNMRVPKTGSWLHNDNQFSGWANDATIEKPILGIEGGDGTGKSGLAACIIDYLRQPHKRTDTNARSYVSYYFMKKDSKAEEDNIASTVSGSMLWQLAESYQPFLKSAASICKKREFIDRACDLWKHLLFENEEFSESKSKSDCIFFFVFDGFTGSAHIDFLNQLLEELKQGKIARHRIRVLITGKKADLERLRDAHVIGMQVIKLDHKNPDVKLFIDHHMKGAESRPWSNDPDTKAKIVDKLKTSSGGNYREIKGTLDQLLKMKDDEEIEKWLKQPDATTTDPIAKAIEDLSRRCSPSDVQDINELILWVIDGEDWLSPLQMEAALLLRSRTLTHQSAGASGRQKLKTGYLKSKLQNEWRRLFEIDDSDDDAHVRFNNTDLDIAIDIIPPRLRSVDDEGHIESSPDIQPAEVKLIEHYLESVCPTETYERFGFAKFFEEKLLQRNNRIYQDPGNAQLILSLRCLTCLVEKRDKVTQTLHGYAAGYLQTHLRSAVSEEAADRGPDDSLSFTDTDLWAQMGTLLVRLFSEDYAINSLFQIHGPFDNDEVSDALIEKELPSIWKFWLTGDEGVELLARYFDDEVVLKPVEGTPLAKAFVSREKRHMALIKPAARLAVKCILTNDATNREVETAFSLLLAAEARSRCQELSKHEDLETYLWTPTAQRVQEVETWSREMAPDDMDRSVWEARMALILLHFSLDVKGHITKEYVQTRAKKAQESGNSTWRVSYALARATEVDSDAAKVLDDLIQKLTTDKTWCNLPSNRPILAEICLDLGDRYWDFDGSPRQDDAIKMYLMSIKEDTSHHERYLGIISRYAKQGLWSHIKSFIEALSKRSHSSDGTPIGKLVVKGVLEDDTFSASLRQTAEKLKRWEFLKNAYDQGLKEKMSYLSAFWIRCAYGEALQSAGNQEDGQLKVWEDILEAKTPRDYEFLSRSVLSLLVPKLMPIYTKRALAAVALEESIDPGNDAPTFAERIDSLYERFQDATDFSTQKVLYFTRYFVLCKDYKRAKESVTELLAQSLDMMSNDDQSDDCQCFWQLQSIFSTFGHVDNAVAAMHMMVVANKVEYETRLEMWRSQNGAKDGPTAKKGKQPLPESESCAQELQKPEELIEERTEEPAEQPTEGIVLACDGCDKEYRSPSLIWTCVDECGLIQLDDECHKRLQIGKDALEKNVCNKDHELFQTPECTVEDIMRRMKDGKVRVGKGDITLQDWKETIIRDYSTIAPQT